MIKKFEIKSHDGPARLGKLERENTPKLFDRKKMTIAPNEGSSYNIDKEIAQLNVRQTLEKAKENVETCEFAVIQGSKYIDLRLECAKELVAICKKTKSPYGDGYASKRIVDAIINKYN